MVRITIALGLAAVRIHEKLSETARSPSCEVLSLISGAVWNRVSGSDGNCRGLTRYIGTQSCFP